MTCRNLGVLFIFLCMSAWAGDEFHSFTDTQGRTIELRVITFDGKHNKVTVERQDGRRLIVSAGNFCEADQNYLQQWFMANELLSEDHLKIDCDDKVIEKRKENVRATQASSSGGVIRDVEIGECRYEKIAYAITFENKTLKPIENAHVEYKIYYEQTKRGVELDPEKMVFRGEADLSTLAPGKSNEFMTQPVEIYNDNLSPQNIVSIDADGTERSAMLEEAEGEVRGIRGRLIVTLPNEKKIVREFHHPSSLSEKKYPWDNSFPSPSDPAIAPE